MGNMAALDAPSTVASDESAPDTGRGHHCACHADQELLGRQLSESDDPHVRIIAHMSNRQLAMAEQLSDLTRSIFKAAGGVANLQEQMKDARAEIRANTTAVSQCTATLGEVVISLKRLTESLERIGKKQEEFDTRLRALESSVSASAPI